VNLHKAVGSVGEAIRMGELAPGDILEQASSHNQKPHNIQNNHTERFISTPSSLCKINKIRTDILPLIHQ